MKRVILLVLVVPLLFVSCGIARSSKSIKKANALHQKAVRALVNYVGDESIVSEGRNPSVKPTAFLLVKDLDKRPVFVSYYKGQALLKESYNFASKAGYDFAVRLGDMASKEFETVLQQTAKNKKTKKPVVATPPPPVKKEEKKPVPPVVATPPPPVKKEEKKPVPPVVATPPPPVKKEEKKPVPPVVTTPPPPVKKEEKKKADVKKDDKKKDEKKKDDKKVDSKKKKETKKEEKKKEKKKDEKIEKKKDEKKKTNYFELYQKYRKKDPEKGDSK